MKVGLSLSGGGVRGAAHIGVLKVFKKHDIPIDFIAGTSAGSLIAALYATGYSAAEMESIFMEYQNSPRKTRALIDPDYGAYWHFLMQTMRKKSAPVDGFVKGDRYENLVETLVNGRGHFNLKDARIPIAIPAVDLDTAKIIMFVSNKTRLIDDKDVAYCDDASYSKAVRASSSFPIVFRPTRYKGYCLIDGGVRENLPSEVLREMGADIIIGIDVGYFGESSEEIHGLMRIAGRTIDIMSYSITEQFAENSDLLVLPKVRNAGTFDFNNIEYCIKSGEVAAENSIELIKRIVK